MIKTVCFIAQNVAETIDPDYSTAMISIRSPKFEVNLQSGWKHLHISEFNDIDRKMYPWKLFDKEQARAMIDFLDNLPDHVDAVIVHCEAGISRSAAVALFIPSSERLVASNLNSPQFFNVSLTFTPGVTGYS